MRWRALEPRCATRSERVGSRTACNLRSRSRVGGAVAGTAEIRSTIFALQAPPTVASVRGDVLRVTDEIATMLRSAPRVRFDGPIDTVVSSAVAEQLVPVVREALTNVAKHAAADRVELHLTATADDLHLVVRDDGVGGLQGREGGFGLRNLRDRAESCGGELEIGVPPGGRGTELRWRVPL